MGNPVRRQSEHFGEYRNALTKLADKGLVYPAFLSRGEVRERIGEAFAKGKDWPSDPDGTPLYPQSERDLTEKEQMERIASGMSYAWRLNMDKALEAAGEPLFWNESGTGPNGESLNQKRQAVAKMVIFEYRSAMYLTYMSTGTQNSAICRPAWQLWNRL